MAAGSTGCKAKGRGQKERIGRSGETDKRTARGTGDKAKGAWVSFQPLPAISLTLSLFIS